MTVERRDPDHRAPASTSEAGAVRSERLDRTLRIALFVGAAVLGAASWVLSMGSTGCAADSPGKGEGEACTRSSECASWLTCSAGVCRGSDAGSWELWDGGINSVDAAVDDAAVDDAD